MQTDTGIDIGAIENISVGDETAYIRFEDSGELKIFGWLLNIREIRGAYIIAKIPNNLGIIAFRASDARRNGTAYDNCYISVNPEHIAAAKKLIQERKDKEFEFLKTEEGRRKEARAFLEDVLSKLTAEEIATLEMWKNNEI